MIPARGPLRTSSASHSLKVSIIGTHLARGPTRRAVKLERNTVLALLSSVQALHRASLGWLSASRRLSPRWQKHGPCETIPPAWQSHFQPGLARQMTVNDMLTLKRVMQPLSVKDAEKCSPSLQADRAHRHRRPCSLTVDIAEDCFCESVILTH